MIRGMAVDKGMPPPAPFIVGVSRSGTTLLRLMLDAHPLLAIPPETHFIPRLVRECRQRGRSAQRRLRDDHNPSALGRLPPRRRGRCAVGSRRSTPRPSRSSCAPSTSPTRSARASRAGATSPPRTCAGCARIAVLPEARFVHLIRDGRDVALSLIEVEWGPSTDRRGGAASGWTGSSGPGVQSRRVEHYLEVRYEELVGDPEPVLRRVCAFVELDFEPSVLSHHERAEGRISRGGARVPDRRRRATADGRRSEGGSIGWSPSRRGPTRGPLADRDVARRPPRLRGHRGAPPR